MLAQVEPMPDGKEIKAQCPVCKKTKAIYIPHAVIENASQLATVSIPKGIVCDHHFQMFIDKHYKIRGYQKVDYQFTCGLEVLHKSNLLKRKRPRKSDEDLIDNLFLDGNFLEYNPSTSMEPISKLKESPLDVKKSKNQDILNQDRKNTERKAIPDNEKEKKAPKQNGTDTTTNSKSLEELYEEFWMLIDDDNEEFREFIIRDKRRKDGMLLF